MRISAEYKFPIEYIIFYEQLRRYGEIHIYHV
ncbi:hypothetical protein OIU74_007476 [Salix koriyanagi]|uniref:Uncharacterized protein n=1 Tax=Salix koriyanagi TaxID=2511006 RepID=A0A9Q0U3T5_9ROSI|nr:hypothetical protein OIU74_007476 [Salix koriyanagi]